MPTRWSWLTDPPFVGHAPSWVIWWSNPTYEVASSHTLLMELAQVMGAPLFKYMGCCTINTHYGACPNNGGSVIQDQRVGIYFSSQNLWVMGNFLMAEGPRSRIFPHIHDNYFAKISRAWKFPLWLYPIIDVVMLSVTMLWSAVVWTVNKTSNQLHGTSCPLPTSWALDEDKRFPSDPQIDFNITG